MISTSLSVLRWKMDIAINTERYELHAVTDIGIDVLAFSHVCVCSVLSTGPGLRQMLGKSKHNWIFSTQPLAHNGQNQAS